MSILLSRAGGVDVSERLGCPFCAVAAGMATTPVVPQDQPLTTQDLFNAI
jgi:hypothetical protein